MLLIRLVVYFLPILQLAIFFAGTYVYMCAGVYACMDVCMYIYLIIKQPIKAETLTWHKVHLYSKALPHSNATANSERQRQQQICLLLLLVYTHVA